MDTVTKLAVPSYAPTRVLSPETREALDAFFGAFGFTAQEDLSRLATWVLNGHGAGPEEAVALARARLEDWLAGVLGSEHVGVGLLSRGRAAFVLCEGAARGAAVLTGGPASVPGDFARMLRAAVPVPAPMPVATTMPEQQLVLWPLGELFRRWWRAGEPDVSISR